ncbi:MAG TPA: hypothetical protein VJA27_02140 [Patescibacteria group bacterium]|nr:hypothetical protein [Patescibacteria group bacterium]
MATPTPPSNKAAVIKNVYLYLVSFVALMMVVFSTADIINIVLRTYVFTKADGFYYSYPGPDCDPIVAKGPRPAEAVAPDSQTKKMTPEECAAIEERNRKQEMENRSSQRQMNLVRDISFIFVGVPLFIYHWRIVRRKE